MDNQETQIENCYNVKCGNESRYTCYYFEKCGQKGCREHLLLAQTTRGSIRLCGACRLLLAIFLPEEYRKYKFIVGE